MWESISDTVSTHPFSSLYAVHYSSVYKGLDIYSFALPSMMHYKLLPDAGPLTHNFVTSRTIRNNDITERAVRHCGREDNCHQITGRR